MNFIEGKLFMMLFLDTPIPKQLSLYTNPNIMNTSRVQQDLLSCTFIACHGNNIITHKICKNNISITVSKRCAVVIAEKQ